jgi:glycosyltransferase involved in cell wall biosynthesis
MNLLISAIVPVYNGDRYLAAAIASILAQNYAPLEILVIDDGSTDDTAKIANQFQQHIRYIYQPNCGAPSARNVGLNMANGEVIAFLDADDIWSKHKLALQIDILTKNPSVEVVLGYHQKTRSIAAEIQDEQNLPPELVLSVGTSLFRRSAFDRVGLFNEELRQTDDWDWFMRARELAIVMMTCPETVLFYRRHDRNITNQIERGNQYTLKMLKQSLDRRRQQGDGLAKSLPKISNFQVQPPESLGS